jgi:hypothetical protein
MPRIRRARTRLAGCRPRVARCRARAHAHARAAEQRETRRHTAWRPAPWCQSAAPAALSRAHRRWCPWSFRVCQGSRGRPSSGSSRPCAMQAGGGWEDAARGRVRSEGERQREPPACVHEARVARTSASACGGRWVWRPPVVEDEFELLFRFKGVVHLDLLLELRVQIVLDDLGAAHLGPQPVGRLELDLRTHGREGPGQPASCRAPSNRERGSRSTGSGRQGGREAGRQGGREAGRQGGREAGPQGNGAAGRQGGREPARRTPSYDAAWVALRKGVLVRKSPATHTARAVRTQLAPAPPPPRAHIPMHARARVCALVVGCRRAVPGRGAPGGAEPRQAAGRRTLRLRPQVPPSGERTHLHEMASWTRDLGTTSTIAALLLRLPPQALLPR